MWGSKGKQRTSVNIQTLIGAGTRVHGDIEFSGGCHVDGEVVGHIRALDAQSATLSISQTGRVEGGVTAPRIVLNGTVLGDVTSGERVEFGSSARVVGNVHYRLIEMAIGAEINGKLVHAEDQPSLLEHAGSIIALPSGREDARAGAAGGRAAPAAGEK
jgi:cytoskeletal protein CcmA (bactofilin family)